MTHVEGFVIAVPTANKAAFIAHAETIDALILEKGATRIVECWGDDVPEGKLTDFARAVQATPDETVCFSWIEWPDKATRVAAHEAMKDLMKTDPRFDPEHNPIPFDGKRMIFGGFDAVVTLEA